MGIWIPAPLPSLWRLFRAHHIQSVSPSLSFSISFFSLLARSKYLPHFSFSLVFTLWSAEARLVHYSADLSLSLSLSLTLPHSLLSAISRWVIWITKEDVRPPLKVAPQMFSITLNKPIKIQNFKIEKCSYINRLIYSCNSTNFFLKYSWNSSGYNRAENSA